MGDVSEQTAISRAVGPVDIRVPADPALSRVMRLAASGMASLAGFTVEEIDDVKVAVSEVLIALIEHGEGHTIDICFDVDGGVFSVRGTTAATAFDADHPDLALCRAVLGGLCLDHRIEVSDAQVTIHASIATEPS